MKFATIATALALGITHFTLAASITSRASSVEGFDILKYQHNINFSAAYRTDIRFIIIKVKPHPIVYFICTCCFSFHHHQLTSTTNRPQKAPVLLMHTFQVTTLALLMCSSFAVDTISPALM